MDIIKQRPLRRRQNKTSDHHSLMLVSLAYTHAQDSLGNVVTRTTIVILQHPALVLKILYIVCSTCCNCSVICCCNCSLICCYICSNCSVICCGTSCNCSVRCCCVFDKCCICCRSSWRCNFALESMWSRTFPTSSSVVF